MVMFSLYFVKYSVCGAGLVTNSVKYEQRKKGLAGNALLTFANILAEKLVDLAYQIRYELLCIHFGFRHASLHFRNKVKHQQK